MAIEGLDRVRQTNISLRSSVVRNYLESYFCLPMAPNPAPSLPINRIPDEVIDNVKEDVQQRGGGRGGGRGRGGR